MQDSANSSHNSVPDRYWHMCTSTSAPSARRSMEAHGPLSPEYTNEPSGESNRNPYEVSCGPKCATPTALTVHPLPVITWLGFISVNSGAGFLRSPTPPRA